MESCAGQVIHHRPEKSKGQMDFGTMGVGESGSMIFTIRNDNPVDVSTTAVLRLSALPISSMCLWSLLLICLILMLDFPVLF